MIVIDVMGDGEETHATRVAEDDAEKLASDRLRYFEWLRRSPQPQLQIVPVEDEKR